MAEFKDFLRQLEEAAKQLIAASLSDFGDAALQDARAFLNRSKAALKRWVGKLAAGELSQEEFESLVRGQKDLAEMEALKQAGLALVRLDKFRKSLFDLVIDTALKVFRGSTC